jgi:hypothetical protein
LSGWALKMNSELVSAVKQKKVFSVLPDSLVWRFLEKNNLDVKSTRADLRKFFGVFLTNRVLKYDNVDILNYHISSKGRDYGEFYGRILEGVNDISGVVDLGCGANGFSYEYLGSVLGNVGYLGIEASGQLVNSTNLFFKKNGFSKANVILGDLFEKEKILGLIKKTDSPRAILMLQVLDALESAHKDYSKDLLLGIKLLMNKDDVVIVTMPMKSISGRKSFEAGRKWLRDFISNNFNLVDEFILGNERVFRFRKY